MAKQRIHVVPIPVEIGGRGFPQVVEPVGHHEHQRLLVVFGHGAAVLLHLQRTALHHVGGQVGSDNHVEMVRAVGLWIEKILLVAVRIGERLHEVWHSGKHGVVVVHGRRDSCTESGLVVELREQAVQGTEALRIDFGGVRVLQESALRPIAPVRHNPAQQPCELEGWAEGEAVGVVGGAVVEHTHASVAGSFLYHITARVEEEAVDVAAVKPDVVVGIERGLDAAGVLRRVVVLREEPAEIVVPAAVESRVQEQRELDHGIRIEGGLEEIKPLGVVFRGVSADDNIVAVVVLFQLFVGEPRRPRVDDQPAGVGRHGRLLDVEVAACNFHPSGLDGAGVLLEPLHIDEAGVPEHRVVALRGHIEGEHHIPLHPVGGEEAAVHLHLQGSPPLDVQRVSVDFYRKHQEKEYS